MADFPTESESHTLKDPADLKKTSKPLSEFSPHSEILPSIDREYRRHAGEVRRRNDGTVRAEPPPSQSAQAKTTNQAKPNQSRKKQTNGLNDDDDSDSDRDRSQRGFGSRDGGITVRKKNQPPLTSNNSGLEARPKSGMAGSSTSILLTPEEEERVKLRRQISHSQETQQRVWNSLLSTRQRNRESTIKDKKHLLRELWTDPEGRRFLPEPYAIPITKQWPNTHVFQLQQLEMSNYLDEALCRDIAGRDVMDDSNYLSKGISRLQLLECVIKEAETKFILRWEQEFSERTVQAIVKSLWTKDTGVSQRELQLLSQAERLEIDEFTAYYEYWVFSQLGFELRYDAQPGRLVIHCSRGWRESDRGISKYLDTIKILSESRNSQQLSQEYINWACRGASPDLIDRSWQRKLQQLRGSRIREMLGLSSTRQEFCEDIDHEGSLSLVLFKGGMPFSIEPVPPLDQERMGWYRIQYGWMDQVRVLSSKFYRYEIDDESGRIFKVGVNGELLALWTPRGEACWVDKNSGLVCSYNQEPGLEAGLKFNMR
ncbi:hypothetical protein EV127DRAFT_446286, partial [Xylaria flabelliformis]